MDKDLLIKAFGLEQYTIKNLEIEYNREIENQKSRKKEKIPFKDFKSIFEYLLSYGIINPLSIDNVSDTPFAFINKTLPISFQTFMKISNDFLYEDSNDDSHDTSNGFSNNNIDEMISKVAEKLLGNSDLPYRDLIKALKPDPSFSIYYQLFYTKTVWNEIYFKNDQIDELNSVLFIFKDDNYLLFINDQLKESITNDINADTFYIIQFCAQICFYMLQFHNQDKSFDEKDAVRYLAYLFAESLIMNDKVSSFETYYTLILGLSAPLTANELSNAFNYLGLHAYYNNNLQLAYDIYYSWINHKVTGELYSSLLHDVNTLPNAISSIESILNTDTEKGRRKNGADARITAIMYMNYSSVCSVIADTYDKKHTKRKEFYNLALKSIRYATIYYDLFTKACPLNSQAKTTKFNYDHYLAYARLLYNSELSNYKISYIIRAYKLINKYSQKCVLLDDMLNSVKANVEVLFQWLFYIYFARKDNINDFDVVIKQIITLLNDCNGYRLFDHNLDGLNTIFSLFLEIESITSPKSDPDLYTNFDNYKHFILYLLLFTECCNKLHKELKRCEYTKIDYTSTPESVEPRERKNVKEIAYYTTLSNFSHLFDELIYDPTDTAPKKAEGPNNADKKNCFTIMHAKYMNDPQEGVPLFLAFNKSIPTDATNLLFSNYTPQLFREKLYQQQFVFLKSFTESIDTLHMWNRYASDRNQGKDSDGCCVVINPNSFGKRIGLSADKTLALTKEKDDLFLYRVVYLSENKEGMYIDKDKNKGISNDALLYFSTLLDLFKLLNNECIKIIELYPEYEEKIIKAVSDHLQVSLRFILFLFKSDIYADECESRLLLTRDLAESQMNTIRLLKTTPPKLCLNPFSQVLVDEVIFGPNVQNVDDWEPYFQHELIKMWKKSDDVKNERDTLDKFKLRQTTIPYRS